MTSDESEENIVLTASVANASISIRHKRVQQTSKCNDENTIRIFPDDDQLQSLFEVRRINRRP